jgi:hypothetical protein
LLFEPSPQSAVRGLIPQEFHIPFPGIFRYMRGMRKKHGETP